MIDPSALSFNGDTLLVAGVVDFSTVVELCDQGDRWLRQSAPTHCRIDFGNVSHCNSAATTLLLSWLRTAKSVKKIILIERVPPALRALMDLGGMANLLPD